ncbi:MAG TPA: AMP-binding protein [Terriglobales bacterium]
MSRSVSAGSALLPRKRLHADPTGQTLHGAILDACHRFGPTTAIVDSSVPADHEHHSWNYSRYAEMLERVAKNFVAIGVEPGDVIAIFVCNSWEFCVGYHAATLAGAIPTPLNPSYREREVRYQLENSQAKILITDGELISGINLSGLRCLQRVFTIRKPAHRAEPFAELLKISLAHLPSVAPEELAALPYSSGTTGLPKGVMLTHKNLVTNVYQFLAPGELATFRQSDVVLDFLPMYHIYGLNVVLNPTLISGGRLVLMPRFDPHRVCALIQSEEITILPLVPPAMNALCCAAEEGCFPKQHKVRRAKSGAAPLAPDLAQRFTSLTGIPIAQGYGMTEASPVTHMGFIEPELYHPESIGALLADTECKLIREDGSQAAIGEPGELVMRGPQFMKGYWQNPDATNAVLRDGWYWSGDMGTRDEQGFFRIVDRRKEMIKYKGFAVAPAEVEAVLLEHEAVRDCGVVGRPDPVAGEVPCAFVVLREGSPAANSEKLASELCGFVAERLSHHKQPREIRFVNNIPRNPSGKILRRELRSLL